LKQGLSFQSIKARRKKFFAPPLNILSIPPISSVTVGRKPERGVLAAALAGMCAWRIRAAIGQGA
jgi:hypothetical protein